MKTFRAARAIGGFVAIVVALSIYCTLVYIAGESIHTAAAAPGGEEYVNENGGFAVTPPEGWDKLPGYGATIVKFRQKGDAAQKGVMMVIKSEMGMPMSVESFVTQLKEFNKETVKDSRVAREGAVEVVGCKAWRLTTMVPLAGGGESTMVQTIVQKSPITFFSLDALIPKGQEEELTKAYDNYVSSFRFVPFTLTKEELSGYENFIGAVRGINDIFKDICVDDHLGIFIKDKKIGDYRLTIEEGSVEGKKGYKVTSRLVLEGDDGIEELTTVCAFTYDFRYQKVDWEDRKNLKKGESVVFKMTGVIDKEKAHIERDLNGYKEAKDIALGDGVVLFSDAAEILRKFLLGKDKKIYLMKVLYLGENSPGIDFLEFSRNEKLEIKKNPYVGHIILMKRNRAKDKVLLYNEKKYLIEDRTLRSPILLQVE